MRSDGSAVGKLFFDNLVVTSKLLFEQAGMRLCWSSGEMRRKWQIAARLQPNSMANQRSLWWKSDGWKPWGLLSVNN